MRVISVRIVGERAVTRSPLSATLRRDQLGEVEAILFKNYDKGIQMNGVDTSLKRGCFTDDQTPWIGRAFNVCHVVQFVCESTYIRRKSIKRIMDILA